MAFIIPVHSGMAMKYENTQLMLGMKNQGN